ncbi:MAG: GGDEF domain-containing protein [Pseudomonadota bacterium]
MESNTNKQQKKEAEFLSIFDIYKQFPFDWSLISNIIHWQSGTELLLGDLFAFETGDQFINRMDSKAFEERVKNLHNLLVSKTPFEQTYDLFVQNDQICTVCEKGRLVNSPQGYPVQFQGVLECVSPPVSMDRSAQPKPPGTKDKNTGFLHRQAIVKHLEKILADDTGEPIESAFVHMRINRLAQIGLQYGLQETQKVIKRIANEIRGVMRDCDEIGRLSGNSFGIILDKCNQHEIVAVAKRLVEAIEFAGIRAKDSNVPIQVAIGGSVIRAHEKITPEVIIQHSERALMDAVNIKKMALPTAFVSQRLQNQEEISHSRRKEDLQDQQS